MKPEVTSSIEPFTSAAHVPDEWRAPTKGRVGYRNGDTGTLRFNGLDSTHAAKLVESLPEENKAHRCAEGAPSAGTILEAVRKSGGKMEARGYVIPPNRTDEKVVLDGVLV